MNYSPGLLKQSNLDPLYVKIENSLGVVIDPATAGFSMPTYDYISVAYPSGTTETYTFKIGGSLGATVATLTVVYTDSSKANLSSVTQT